MTDLGSYLTELFSFAHLSRNPGLVHVLESFDSLNDFFAGPTTEQLTETGSGLEALITGQGDKKVRLALTWTGIETSKRQIKVELLESPDGSRGSVSLDITASTWTPSSNMAYKGHPILGGQYPEGATITAASAALAFDPGGRGSDRVDLALDAKDFRSGEALAHILSAFAYSEWSGPGNSPFGGTISPVVQGLVTRPLAISDLPPFKFPSSITLAGSVAAENVSLNTSLSYDNKFVTLSGAIGPVDLTVASFLDATTDPGHPDVSRNSAYLRVRDRANHIGFFTSLITTFQSNSGSVPFSHEISWGPHRLNLSSIKSGTTTLGNIEIFDDEGTKDYYAPSPSGGKLATLQPIAVRWEEASSRWPLVLQFPDDEVKTVKFKDIFERWTEANRPTLDRLGR